MARKYLIVIASEARQSRSLKLRLCRVAPGLPRRFAPRKDSVTWHINEIGLPLMPMHNPPHPGEFILATYMEPFGVSCRTLAAHPNVAASTLNRILKRQSGVSPEMALRLSKAIGRSPESWLAMQDAYDLWVARKSVKLSDVQRMNLTAA